MSDESSTPKRSPKQAGKKTLPRDPKGDDASSVVAVLAAMPDADRILGERLHAIIQDCAPTLTPKLWYGMPAYAKNGKVVCFFQGAQKFKTRYATLGFMHEACLDDGAMWPTAFALTAIHDAEAAQIRQLVLKAVG